MSQRPFDRVLRIGTRGSPMALAQTGMVRDRIVAAHPGLETEIVVVTTVADRVLDRPLSEIGGKGLFTKELEQALFADEIDVAVHSMKDVETWLPDGLVIASILERDDPRDAFLARDADGFDDLPEGARVGTSSLRRGAQVLMRRPDLRIVPLRGNANTRMRKLEAGECDATLLALAGLQRLGMEDVARSVLSVDEMLPAVAQGALGIECREDDEAIRDLLAAVACATTTIAVGAERALLAELDGSCRTPIAALARIEGDRLSLDGLLFLPDGSRHWAASRSGPVADAERIGREAGAELKAAAGDTYRDRLQ
ncbi:MULTISPECIES: hydroxymethylbilane synthase [Methylobacterium]|uniref:Porphobilinogen deaminase n=1 Tax=Methylobacterium jeotgali TaxID=381630 RepID=A0ABQ4STD0_9HYPH|nr:MULTISPECIES: hydroxymethylbilane synthase [Methylobacterium]PIU07716.1 MAG: hydroxymethylbilane synthase [Methylobacterium sp. CG09_land_8_20_14_0_10_71_15]PIU11419.1 MAG: hydroxymethylbilane synthase [Methylobacterium sp. CG08_land_8_20_14_0_20_71_15]GBU18596.1 porphobilinogen deaminase [Methylobacterium sp.]GJE05118.1 Porphobilinogen deaminase [Methylobacterium jeotgali]